MLNLKDFFSSLHKNGVDFFTGVPDSLLNDFCKYLMTNVTENKHVLTANEGNAIALAAGYHLATGTVPLVYMQNSGIGNAMNPLLSLTNKEVYSIPLVLLIGWRGDPEIVDHAQHKKQGELTPVLLEAMDIPFRIIDNEEQKTIDSVKWAVDTAKRNNSLVALIVKKGVLSKPKGEEIYQDNDIYPLTRAEAIEIVIDNLPKDTIYVASTGRITRELYWLRERKKQTHKNDFLNVGAMGHTSSIALGIALANSKRLVVCLDGDAAAIMHLGSFAINANQKLHNFIHIILNNGAHESVGGQVSLGFKVNLSQIAKNAGYFVMDDYVKSKDEIELALNKYKDSQRPYFINIYIKKGISGKLPPLEVDLIELKHCLTENIMEKN